ncbi:MAG: class I SAM-dependent methyltransferase [Myxococcales bacterium]
MNTSLRVLALAATLVAAGACKERPSDAARAVTTSAPAEGAPAMSAPAAAHDPAHPPIDCPLRKQGIDHTALRPFAEVEEYIAFLEREDRAIWQRPDEVIAALGLKGDELVADIGAGSGYFSFRFAKALPRGRVVAVDVEPEMVRHIHHRALSEGVSNLEAVVSKPDEPSSPPGADLVFICDVLHHVPDRAAWLGKLAAGMKSGARLALVEFKEGELPQGPPEGAKIPRAKLLELASDAGLKLVEEKPELLPYQTFLVFQQP